MSDERFESWAILELMGHRRLAGFVTEQEIGGTNLLRIDVPALDGETTQFYSASAIYCITPTTEEVARAVAKRTQPRPVHAFELAPPADDSIAGDDFE